MPSDPRSAPIHAPRLPDQLLRNFRAIIADPKARPGAYIRLQVSGGAPSERFDFEYRVDAAGRTAGHLLDELKGRRIERFADRIKPRGTNRFAALAKSIDIEGLLRSSTPRGGFPPDSLVGRLEIGDGDQAETFVFLADEEQARRAEQPAPDPLRKAVDAVWRTAATDLGTDDVRP